MMKWFSDKAMLIAAILCLPLIIAILLVFSLNPLATTDEGYYGDF